MGKAIGPSHGQPGHQEEVRESEHVFFLNEPGIHVGVGYPAFFLRTNMKLMKRISKIYNWPDERVEGCVNRNEHTRRTGLLMRTRTHRGLTLPEAMVSMSIFSMFMTVCCGSMVQYQTTFGRVERSMTYTQQLQAGMDMMVREISESNLSTFKNAQNAALIFPINLSKSPVYFKLATGTNAHGDNSYDTNKISLSVNSKNQLVREETLPDGTVMDSKTLAVDVDEVVLSRLPEGNDYIPNAISILMTSTTTLSSKEQAMQQNSTPPETHTVSNERNYVSIERVVRLNN